MSFSSVRDSRFHLWSRLIAAAAAFVALAFGRWPLWFNVVMGVLLISVIWDGVSMYRRYRREEEAANLNGGASGEDPANRVG